MSENRAVRVAALLLLMIGISFAQVQNAADANAGVSGASVITPGSQAFVNDPVQLAAFQTVNSASVSIRPVGSATPIPAQVLGTSQTGITFVVPPDTPLGNAQLIYNQTGQLTQSTSVSIVSSRLALYRNPVRAVNTNASGPATPNGLANPAQPGQAVEIFATGLTGIPQYPPQVLLGNVAQSVLFAGSGGPAGLLQINFVVSADAPDGCYVPLTVTWGVSTATSSISKTSDGKACHHPFGLPTQALQTLDAGGTVETGLVTITRALSAASVDHASRSEQAVVSITPLSAAQVANYAIANTAASCGVGGGSLPFWASYIFDPSQFPSSMTLQSGATTLQLPSGGGPEYSITIPPTADAPLNHLPAPVLGGGAWTWSSSVGQFGFNLLPPVQMSGGAPIRIQTDRNQTITWDASGFDAGAIMQLSLSAGPYGPASITCFAAAQGGALTIPSNLLRLFTPGGAGVVTASVVESGAAMPHANFQLSGGIPLLMLVSEGSTDTRPVDFQ
jgi:uncharacterized protein (TIGR03437 family)